MSTESPLDRWLDAYLNTHEGARSAVAAWVYAAGPALTEQAYREVEERMPIWPQHAGYEQWKRATMSDCVRWADRAGLPVHPDHR